jgi:hypothetical protein
MRPVMAAARPRKETKHMTTRFSKVLLASCVCVGCAGAASAASPRTPTNDPSDVATIRQISQDMGDALIAADMTKLDQIFAADWEAIGSSGAVVNREKFLRGVESGENRLVWFKTGPIDVQVLGNVAVAHGTVFEKRIRGSQSEDTEAVWMDLLEKRAGKWVVVRSGGASPK